VIEARKGPFTDEEAAKLAKLAADFERCRAAANR